MLEKNNRYRISTKFTTIKVVVCFVILSTIFNLVRDIKNHNFELKLLAPAILIPLISFGVIYLIRTNDSIEYDDILQTLYIMDSKGKQRAEIPVEKIDEISYSSFTLGRNSKSYVIHYRNSKNQQKSIRLFPIPFDKAIQTIIVDAKFKNPTILIND